MLSTVGLKPATSSIRKPKRLKKEYRLIRQISIRLVLSQYNQAMTCFLSGIVHRDLKLENILIAGCRKTEKEDPLYDIKVRTGSCNLMFSLNLLLWISNCFLNTSIV